MKARKKIASFSLAALVSASLFAQSMSATEIIKKADDKMQGETSSKGEMTMTIVRPKWERKVSFKIWTKGKDYSMTLITAPSKEKGQSFLKRKNEMWNWNPSIRRLIKLPPSMMSQGWMGSDYTNDDILKESSLLNDYTHEIIGEDKIGERTCYKIKLKAKEDAAVVWGSQIRWVDKKDFMFIKIELYDEDDYLIRTEFGENFKVMDGRLIPSRMVIVPAQEDGQKTIIDINSIEFNKTIADGFFSQQNMKRLR